MFKMFKNAHKAWINNNFYECTKQQKTTGQKAPMLHPAFNF